MKVNQIGIQSYQQINRQDSTATEQRRNQAADTPVQIEPQAQSPNSPLAVKAAGKSYLDSLSTDERKALELLFSRFRDTGRFGANYKQGGEPTGDDASLGALIDVKV